jgi:DNA ligase (NAD+)
LTKLERQGAKSIENLIKAVKESKEQPPWRMVFGLGILHVGVTAARTLMEFFGSIDKLAMAEVPELLRCEDVGEVVAASLQAWFRDERNLQLLERLRVAGLTFEQRAVQAASEALAGTTWVITGTLSRPREEMAELIRSHGGKISSSVSAKTSCLLAGEEAGQLTPERKQRLVLLAQCEGVVGHSLEKAGKKEEAKGVFGKALETWKKLEVAGVTEDVVKQGVAWTQDRLGKLK